MAKNNNNHPAAMPQIQITPQLAETIAKQPYIKCIVCGSEKFVQSFMFKAINKIISPLGIDSEVTFAAFECKQCGHTRGIPAPEKN